MRVTAVEAQHFSGRGLRRDGTLWASWVLAGPAGKVFFSGDTGFFDGYSRIGAEHGPFDTSLMAVGAYDLAWHDIHLDPEEAVEATRLLSGGLLLPIHWCTFVLAPHPWAEPVERLLVAAASHGMPVAVPRVGDRVDVADPPGLDAWWAPESATSAPATPDRPLVRRWRSGRFGRPAPDDGGRTSRTSWPSRNQVPFERSGSVFPQAAYPFPREDVAERWRREVAAPDVDCFVVLVHDVVQGFAATRGDELLHFGIAVEHWGTGVAERAHDAVLDRLAARGVDLAWLTVFTGNGRGRAFYEKLGWQPTDIRVHSSFLPHPELIRYERAVRDPRRQQPQVSS